MIKRVNIDQVHAMMAEETDLKLYDIRDPNAFSAGHMVGAENLNGGNFAELTAQCEFDTPIVVICYHGHSSLTAGQVLINHGFENVMSMDGGFEAWRQSYPFEPA